MINKGYEVENLIVEELNCRKYKDLSFFWKTIVKRIFIEIKPDEFIFSKRIGGKSKADIAIKYKNETKYISVKYGDHNSFHGENVFKFISFLNEIGVSKRTIKILLFYHFGDGTLNGTGKIRFSAEELKCKYGQYLDQANYELNKKEIILKVMTRCVIEGTESSLIKADYIYYGDSHYGYLVSVDQILDFAKKHPYKMFKGLHFGPLNYQPYKRKLNSDKKMEERFISQIKWISLFSDIQKMSSKNKRDF